MHKVRNAAIVIVIAIFFSASASAQRPRTVNESPSPATTSLPPPPSTVSARYEGGVFGYNRKVSGTLTFDDPSERLVFRNKEQRELFSIPYQSITAAFVDVKSRRPAAATVAGSIPAPYGLNIPAWFVRKKYRYLTLQYNDPDTNVSGITSFKIDRDVLPSVLGGVAKKAGLTARGEIFVRKTPSQTQSVPGS